MNTENRNPYDAEYGINQPNSNSASSASNAGAQSTPAQAAPTQAAPAAANAAASTASAQPSFAQPFSDGAAVQGGATAQGGVAAQGAYAAAAVQPAPSVNTKSGKGWIVGIVVTLAIMIICIVSVVSCTSTVGMVMNPFSAMSSSNSMISATSPSVAIIEMDGTIQYDGTSCSPEGLKDLLDEASEDPNIEAVILHVNSGGGVATAGEEMSEYVKNFDKPIVVSSAALNASAAYEISSQSDYIFVDKTTSIGSIGVIMQVTDLSGLYDKLGIRIENITSADAKDAGSGSRPLTAEEREWYQGMVDQINDIFIQTVADGREMDEDEVRSLATGLLFTGVDAVDNGLADEIGLLEDAVAKASELAGYDYDLPVISLTSSASELMDLLDLLGSSKEQTNSAALRAIADRLEINGALG